MSDPIPAGPAAGSVFERGSTMPSLARMEQIADALGVSLPDLFRFKDSETTRDRAVERLLAVLRHRPAEDIDMVAEMAKIAFAKRGHEAKVVEFANDDHGYLAWTRQHPAGYVLNSLREPKARHLKLHRASCGLVRGKNRGSTWTAGQYVKVCSESVEELREWAVRKTGERLAPCGACRPG